MINKQYILLQISLIGFLSCNTIQTETTSKSYASERSIDEQIAKWIKANANDPDSYEPISTTLIRTDYLLERIKKNITNDSLSIQSYKETILRESDFSKEQEDFEFRMRSGDSEEGYKNTRADFREMKANRMKEIEQYKKEVDNLKKSLKVLQNKVDSILQSSDKNPIEKTCYLHKCRMRVPLGGKMLKGIEFYTDKDLNIISGRETVISTF